MYIPILGYIQQYIRPISFWIAGVGVSASLISKSSILYDNEIALIAANSVINCLQIDPNSTNLKILNAKRDSLGFWARSTLQIITNNQNVNIKVALKCDSFNENQFNLLDYVKEPFLIKSHLKQILGLYNKKNSLELNDIKRWKVMELVTDTDLKIINNNIDMDKLKDIQISHVDNILDSNIQNKKVYSLLCTLVLSIIASATSLFKFSIAYKNTRDCIKYVNNVAINFHKNKTCTVKRSEGVIKPNYFDGKVHLSDNSCIKIVACQANKSSDFTTHVCKYKKSN